VRQFVALLLSLAAAAAWGQGNVIRIVVPFAPGGVQDILARSLNAELGAALGRSVIVENRPGAGGTVGTGSVARSAPDGTTLVLAAASHTIAGSLYARLAYDPIADFTGVAHIGTADYVLMINAGVPALNVKDFVFYLKNNPGKLNYATAGNGSATHLSMAYFCGLAGVEMVHIPLKATGEAVNEVLAGRAHAVIAASIGALPYLKDSRVRMLGSTGAQRSRFIPELPAIGESLPGYEFDSWFALLAPVATPRTVLDQVNAAVAGLLKDPVILGRLDRQGVVPQAMTPDALNALLKADFQKMARVVKASGVRID
jgi:tripartite-type tricarboxylate transporter receptor subunit TctC